MWDVTFPAFQKRFKKNHILNKPPGLAADVDILTEATELGAEYCQFASVETGDIYFAPIEWLLVYGVRLDRGYGAQKVLPLPYWSVNGESPKRKPAAIVEAEKEAERAARNVPEQMSLFEVAR